MPWPDVRGKRCLDVGTYDGFLAFELERRGAASVVATDIMWNEIQRFREHTHRPTVACLLDMGTSGAYYLATACDEIVAHPMSITGGIGVVLNLYNLEDFLGTFNLRTQSVKSRRIVDRDNQTAALTTPTRRAAAQRTMTAGSCTNTVAGKMVTKVRSHI